MRGLEVWYGRPPSGVPAVMDLDLHVDEGEILGLVGESGSGKSTAIMAMLRVLSPPGVIARGSVRFAGQEVLRMGEEALRQWRWRDVALVPQSALHALNPVLTVGQHFADTLRAHGITDRAEVGRRGSAMLRLVDLDPSHLDSYPHTLSGGMRQRVAVALALVLEPRLVFFDEPTTALDVVVERELLQRVVTLQKERGFGVLFITHDLGLLMEVAHRIGVLYSGRLVEDAPVASIQRGGRHPYTRGLLAAMPTAFGKAEPTSIPGSPPQLDAPPSGCRFHPRCARAIERCTIEVPEPESVSASHRVACFSMEDAH